MGRRGLLRWWVAEIEEGGRFKVQPPAVMWEPTRSVCVLVDGVWQDASEPLLPGYVLVGARVLPPVEGGRLLSRHPLTKAEVDRLKRQEFVAECRPVGRFFPGDRVRIRKDARTCWAGLEAVFLAVVSTRGGFYARVDVEAYGTRVREYLPLDYLER